MFWRKTLLVLLVVMLLVPSAASRAAGPFDDLLRRIPNEANALVLINALNFRSSEFAIKHLTGQDRGATHLNRAIVGRKQWRYVVLAANLDPATESPIWEIGLAKLNKPLANPLKGIARIHGGREESLGGVPSVLLPSNAYFIQFEPELVAVTSPADRQLTARWANRGQSNPKPELSPYLMEAAGYSNNVGTEIVMALDVEYIIDKAVVRQRLDEMKCLAGRDVDLDQLAELLASIRGATLGIRVTDQPHGRLRIDFKEDAAMVAAFAKPLILEILARRGALVDDLRQWTPDVDGKTVFLGGTLSMRGLRQVLSVIDPPAPQLDEEPGAGSEAGNAETMAEATLRNFQAIQKLLKEIRRPADANIITAGQYGMWLERYARKIDGLPILNVDEEMLNFGSDVAQGLRALGGQSRNVGVTASTSTRNVDGYFLPTEVSNIGYQSYYRMGYYKPTGLSPYQKTKRAETAKTASSGIDIMQHIEQASAQMRRRMTQKYQIEF